MLIARTRPLVHARSLRLSRFSLTGLALVVTWMSASPALAHETGNQRINGFRAAKTLLRILYAEHPVTLYSDCRFDATRHVDYTACHYEPIRQNERAHRIEWEHIVPAESFGRAIEAWRAGDANCQEHNRLFRGRKCAAKVSSLFRHMEGDMYNLVPEIGELNQRRSNLPMAAIAPSEGEALAGIGGCVAKHGFSPRDGVKGDVARTYLYMNEAYPETHLLSAQKEKLFAAWAASDAVDAWECRRASRIEAMQGNENRFVRVPCLAAQLWPQTATYSKDR